MSDINRQIIELANARLSEADPPHLSAWVLAFSVALMTIAFSLVIAVRKRRWLRRMGAGLLSELRINFPDYAAALTQDAATRFFGVILANAQSLKRLGQESEDLRFRIREHLRQGGSGQEFQDRLEALEERLLGMTRQDEEFLIQMAESLPPGLGEHILGPARPEAIKRLAQGIKTAISENPRPYLS